MPIVKDVGTDTWKLQCVNRHLDTMVEVSEDVVLPAVVSTVYGPVASHGLKIRCFYCTVCRYTELYMANKAELPSETQDADPSPKPSPPEQ